MQKILIVAQDELLAYTIERMLYSPDVETYHLSTDECVVEWCQNHECQLIIFTQLRPYFTSMNIVEHLREALDVMPRIFVLAKSHSENTILTLLECGVDQYITLPVNLYRLKNKVFTVLKCGA